MLSFTPPSLFVRRLALAFALLPAACAHGGGGKKKEEPACAPADEAFKKVKVIIQPTDDLNVDDQGNPLSVVFRLYQLKGGKSIELLDFDTIWQKSGAEAFGDELLAEQELVVYPQKPELLEIEPAADMTHLVAVAIYRRPIGQDWFRVWERPKYHGESVCAAKREGRPWPEPCFFVLLDQYLVDGGHTPPSGFDRNAVTVQCPGPPAKSPPPPPPVEPSRKEKKRKKLKDAKMPSTEVPAAEAPAAPTAPQAPSAPQAPTAPQAPQAPTAPQAPSLPK